MTKTFDFRGSEKQVAWATDIIAQSYNRIEQYAKSVQEREAREGLKYNWAYVCKTAQDLIEKNLEKMEYSAHLVINNRDNFIHLIDVLVYRKNIAKVIG